MTKAHLAASYAIGDPDSAMIEIPDQTCACGLRLVGLLGAIIREQQRWDVWIKGNYEHVDEPVVKHIPNPIGEWRDAN